MAIWRRAIAAAAKLNGGRSAGAMARSSPILPHPSAPVISPASDGVTKAAKLRGGGPVGAAAASSSTAAPLRTAPTLFTASNAAAKAAALQHHRDCGEDDCLYYDNAAPVLSPARRGGDLRSALILSPARRGGGLRAALVLSPARRCGDLRAAPVRAPARSYADLRAVPVRDPAILRAATPTSARPPSALQTAATPTSARSPPVVLPATTATSKRSPSGLLPSHSSPTMARIGRSASQFRGRRSSSAPPGRSSGPHQNAKRAMSTSSADGTQTPLPSTVGSADHQEQRWREEQNNQERDRENLFWFRVCMMGAGAIAFLYEALTSMVGKEVEYQMNKRELANKDQEIEERKKKLELKDEQLRQMETELEKAQRRWF